MPVKAPVAIIERTVNDSPIEVDKTLKNKFLWSWMDQT